MENKVSERKKQKSLAIWLFISLLFALIISQLAGGYIANIFTSLFVALMPILLGFFFAYLLKNLVVLLEQKVFHKLFLNTKKPKTYRRILSLCIVFIVFLLLIILILMSVIPLFINRITDLVNNSSEYINKVTTQLTEFFSNIKIIENLNLQENIVEIIEDFSVNLEMYLPVLLERALRVASDTTIIVLNIILSFLLAFLMLKDKEKITEFFKRFTYANLKIYRADKLIKITRKSDEVLNSYFIGKCIEAAIIFVTVSIGFYVIGIPDALLLSAIIALFNFIPYVGAVIGLVPTLVLTIIFASVNTALWGLFYALLVVIFITSFISPVIFGKKLKVSALLIILSIIIGGGMFGVLGMLFAPPIVAILAIIIEENIREKEELKLIISSHGLTEDDIKENEVLIEATKLTLEKKNQTKKP
ncbi:MAG: hypothetical protein CVV59_01195 [Tenericutes bacterium HGW-Tenericutes-4]|nr:MAG: hypothetical protein CVV59_01195 [Tenericutes bacterium HGW-Tenericutes-4]